MIVEITVVHENFVNVRSVCLELRSTESRDPRAGISTSTRCFFFVFPSLLGATRPFWWTLMLLLPGCHCWLSAGSSRELFPILPTADRAIKRTRRNMGQIFLKLLSLPINLLSACTRSSVFVGWFIALRDALRLPDTNSRSRRLRQGDRERTKMTERKRLDPTDRDEVTGLSRFA